MNNQDNTPISLNSQLSTTWHFTKECGEQITKLVKHKVCNVSETKISGVITWTGCFDNDEYFLIIAIDGVVYAACGEREMMLPYDLHTVAHIDEVLKVIEIKDQVEQFRAMIQLKTTFLEKFMSNLKFQEIMDIFMWEYISDKVEIYETIIL